VTSISLIGNSRSNPPDSRRRRVSQQSSPHWPVSHWKRSFTRRKRHRGRGRFRPPLPGGSRTCYG